MFYDEEKFSSPLLLFGTKFQIKVWKTLLRISDGNVVSYQDVASIMGLLSSTRAVASAIARNEISYLIPCHRVISKTGLAHHYRWGADRKVAILKTEMR